jgi:hypothetical protein
MVNEPPTTAMETGRRAASASRSFRRRALDAEPSTLRQRTPARTMSSVAGLPSRHSPTSMRSPALVTREADADQASSSATVRVMALFGHPTSDHQPGNRTRGCCYGNISSRLTATENLPQGVAM